MTSPRHAAAGALAGLAALGCVIACLRSTDLTSSLTMRPSFWKAYASRLALGPRQPLLIAFLQTVVRRRRRARAPSNFVHTRVSAALAAAIQRR
ncbi:MAG: hypothetical protein K8J09_08055 [Planctomycetes bacterium]|nr:hypothetical protein [Planctomycetota bacterium]MCC7398036.1 hypothetical protein [Planctomycetota bacterium]